MVKMQHTTSPCRPKHKPLEEEVNLVAKRMWEHVEQPNVILAIQPLASNCPNRRVITIVEEMEEVGEDSLKEGIDTSKDEHVLYTDEGEILVVRCLLSVEPSNKKWCDTIFSELDALLRKKCAPLSLTEGVAKMLFRLQWLTSLA